MNDSEIAEEIAARRADREQKRKRKKIIIVSAAAVIFAAVLGNIFFGPDRVKGNKTVEIPQGSSMISVADTLKKEKIISKKMKFIAEVIFSGNRGKLKFGKFSFEDGMTYREVVDTLVTEGAKKETVTLSIPEGYSIENIITKMTEAGLGDEESINKALSGDYDYKFLSEIPEKDGQKYKLQGFLFPSTYEFYADSSPETVIDAMLKEFEKQYLSVADNFDNVYDISGVINNRLDKGMKLQLCASVLYVITDGKYDKQKVYYKDLEVKSPYNTYLNAGLPAGPVANPGIKSIKAALEPEKHDYLYYHTNEEKNDGSHIFTKTFEEHESTLAN